MPTNSKSKPKFLVAVAVRGEGNAEAMCAFIESLEGMTTFIVQDSVGYESIPEKTPTIEVEVDGKARGMAYTVHGLGFTLHKMLKGKKELTVTLRPRNAKVSVAKRGAK